MQNWLQQTLDAGRIGIAGQALGIGQVSQQGFLWSVQTKRWRTWPDLGGMYLLNIISTFQNFFWKCLGLLLQASLDCAIAYAKDRQAFDQPIAKLQAIQVSERSTKREVFLVVTRSRASLETSFTVLRRLIGKSETESSFGK